MMSTSLKFPAELKDAALSYIRELLQDGKTDEDKKNLLENSYWLVDEETPFFKVIKTFSGDAAYRKVINQNVIFCRPNHADVPPQGNITTSPIKDVEQLVADIFDDFILHTLRVVSHSPDQEDALNKLWLKFEEEFFTDEIEVSFVTQLVGFFYNAGGIIEDLVPNPDITIRYLTEPHSTPADIALYHFLKRSVEHGFFKVAPEEFTKASGPIIVEYRKIIPKKGILEFHLRDAASVFEKIALVVRIICGGSIHFDFITAIYLGNKAKENYVIQTYPANHIFSEAERSSAFDQWHYGSWFKNLWQGIESRDITEWQFAHQKIRDSHTRTDKTGQTYHFDKSYFLSLRLERTVDIIQAIEAVVGDLGLPNAEYISIMIARGDPQFQKLVYQHLYALYKIRHKYIHGKYHGSDSVIHYYNTLVQGDLEKFDEYLDASERHLQDALAYSVINADLQTKIRTYHDAMVKYKIAQKKGQQLKPPLFPALNNHYHR